MTETRLPDFLIIGAMKCGTSTLQVQLASQQGVFMTTPKEPNFFSDDPVYAQGLDWYHSLFDPAEPGVLKGEASTHYTKLPTYPDTIARMRQVLTSPRLVYVIRNPVERAISQYLHEWSKGSVGRDVARAFETSPEFIAYSRYPEQISPFVEQFGAENVLLTSLEQIKKDPDGELQRIGAHIRAPAPCIWNHELGAQNVSAQRVRPLPFHNLLVRHPVARAIRQALVPKSIRNRIKSARTRDDRPSPPEALRRELEVTFRPDQAELARLFPDFSGLARSYPFA